MKTSSVVILLVLGVTLAACQKKEGGAAGAGESVTVNVLDQGAEPRQVLRYKFKAGTKTEMVMDIKMAMAMEVGSMKQPEIQIPVIRMVMSLENKEITKDGDLRYEFNLVSTEILADPDTPPAMVQALEAEEKKLVGMSGFSVVDSRGLAKDGDIKVPPGADAKLNQMVDDLRAQLRNLSAPLPVEAVGKGARWEVTTPLKNRALSLTQVATYSLERVDGDRGQFAVSLIQSAGEQDMKMAELPSGARAHLNYLKSTGSGTVDFDLASLIPKSALKMAMAMDATIEAGGQKQAMKTTMRMEFIISPKGNNPEQP